MGIITQYEAKEKGLKSYYTGKPCKYGHYANRLISNRTCIRCLVIKQQELIKIDPIKRKKRNKRVINKLKRRPDIVKRQCDASYARDPSRRKARRDLNNAIRDGRIERKPCRICGNGSEADHSDYNKPLEVDWLCQKHHQEEHKRVSSWS